ncbi:hypothetical protein QPK31_22285 [Massilia sp. YIM B02769]|uniref:esterase/lipase family protein n=1 Tax=unclassified Massilia TaxID=2609279 RepID=UPI0025B7221D|nr:MULTISPECIES: hypothetical protein [unclassified Massilia]MDN4060949.1 hypothetical protein [Massilia sp. YIM B02769]
MAESTRPLPPLIPLSHGGWEARSVLSSAEYTIRGLGLMPANTVIPVIVVPGIMGTNLRAKQKPRLSRLPDERNKLVAPGKIVWRPPNGKSEGWRESSRWDQRSPADRQRLFDAATLEVDDGGIIVLPDAQDEYTLTEDEVRQRGWGEVHADSYGELLYALQTRLNQTFGYDDQAEKRFVNQHWKEVMACDPRRWGLATFAPLTEAQLEKHARVYYPVYCVGYNWLEDCEVSSKRLEKRISEILESWIKAKRRCEKVILVTHSMGGLVARACARRIPNVIAGVIHGVMPTFGAPVAYRRIACGTESSSPSNGLKEEVTAFRMGKILGQTTERTSAVLTTSPGALELLPNHLYPAPWLHVRVTKVSNPAVRTNYEIKGSLSPTVEKTTDLLHLPSEIAPNPYDLYRDMRRWYRLANPAIADPARMYRQLPGGVEHVIRAAIDTAETFHRTLGNYYHPNTYAFYGSDRAKLSYGQVRWVARQWEAGTTALTTSNVVTAQYLGHTSSGERRVLVAGKAELSFEPEAQDGPGDGTVPRQSGIGPTGHVKQVFEVRGVDHQESFKNSDVLLLTLRLIVKIAQESS